MSLLQEATEELNEEHAEMLGTDHTQFVYKQGKKWEYIEVIVERTLQLRAELVWSWKERDTVEEVKRDALERLQEFRDEFSRILEDSDL